MHMYTCGMSYIHIYVMSYVQRMCRWLGGNGVGFVCCSSSSECHIALPGQLVDALSNLPCSVFFKTRPEASNTDNKRAKR